VVLSKHELADQREETATAQQGALISRGSESWRFRGCRSAWAGWQNQRHEVRRESSEPEDDSEDRIGKRRNQERVAGRACERGQTTGGEHGIEAGTPPGPCL